MRRERMLILGGGLIGGHVAVQLAKQGHAVRVVSRSFNPWLTDQVLEGADVELRSASIGLTEELVETIEDADRVFFLAGASTPTHANRNTTSSAMDSVLTALTVLDLMRATSTRRVILASSGGTVYGEPRRLPTPEDHPLDPISIHGLNSLVTERYARFFADQHGLRMSVLRYSNVYGPGQTGRRGQGVVTAWLKSLAAGEPVQVFGGLDVRRDFVYVDDAASATALVGLSDETLGTYNVGSQKAVRLGEVIEVISGLVDRAPTIRQEPARGLDVRATELDCTRLKEATGWAARIPLDQGVRESWRWLQAHQADGERSRRLSLPGRGGG